jgi:hypothetical protein
MDGLTPFERDVIDAILAGDHPVLEVLRAQLAACEVSKRDFTGVGFFTTVSVQSDVPSAPVNRFLHLGEVGASMDGLANGAGFILFVDRGRLNVLEAYTYGGEAWPAEISNYKVFRPEITYSGGAQTDLEQIDAAWLRP